MCGIAGHYHYKSGQPASRGELARAARRLAHRGPDGEGLFVDGPLGLCHRRLSIIDIGGGAQPMATSDGQLVISYNGEIYNYVELFEELEALGFAPRTRSDTEAVLLAYRAWGLDFVRKLNGMFAFALWDAPNERLVLCRDRMGIKPLYWAETSAGVCFASELKALRGASGVDATIDPDAVDDFMTLGYVVHPRTFLRGVRSLEPGTMMIVEPESGAYLRRYWSLRFAPDPRPSANEWAEEVRALFDSAVRIQLRSDVPVGVLLSGGLDSTAVAATVARARDMRQMDTFCVGVDVPAAKTDLAWAAKIAADLGSRHHERRLGAEEHASLLREATAFLDEPLAEPMCAQLLSVCRMARDAGVKVVLTGEGADEIFFGYSSYRTMFAMEWAQRLLPPSMRKGRFPAALGHIADMAPNRPRFAKALRILAEPLERRYLSLSFFDTVVKDRLYRPEFAATLARRDSRELVRHLYDEGGGPESISRMAAVDCRSWLASNVLVRSDRMSMAASIELRVPFLDHRLVELAARIPARHKVQLRDQKVVLKRAVADRVPAEVLSRAKLGFPTPISELLRGDFGAEAERLLTAPDARAPAFFDVAAVRRLFAQHRAGVDYSRVLWQLVSFEYFGRAVEAPEWSFDAAYVSAGAPAAAWAAPAR